MVDLSVSVKRFWRRLGFRQILDFIQRPGCVSKRAPRGQIYRLLAATIVVIATPSTQAQTNLGPSGSTAPVAVIKSFRVVQEKDGPALEILSTKPLVPTIHA